MMAVMEAIVVVFLMFVGIAILEFIADLLVAGVRWITRCEKK